jgi:CxxC-x17-CxxC domain-containing protein
MSFTEKKLVCADCGSDFIFSATEQEFYASKGFVNEPKRCPSCRQSRKIDRRGGNGGRSERQMFKAVCAKCGNDTMVPFQPTQDKPVYCSDCYNKIKLSR